MLAALGQSGLIPGAGEGVNPTQTIWLRMKRGEILKVKIQFLQCEKLGVDKGGTPTNAPHNQQDVLRVVTLSCLMCGDSNGELLNSLTASTMSHKINFSPPKNCRNHGPPFDGEKCPQHKASKKTSSPHSPNLGGIPPDCSMDI